MEAINQYSYKIDHNFNKFAELLNCEEYKERIYKFYLDLNEESRKRLFLFLLYSESRSAIYELLGNEGALTMKGITNYIINEKNIFQSELIYTCNNFECNRHYIKTKDKLFSKCPECGSKVKLTNLEEVLKIFDYLYLNYFDFYILNESDVTRYLIYNKYSQKYYIKRGDEPLSNFIYLTLLSNNCDVKKFLFIWSGTAKNPKNNLLNYMKENNFIQRIDNLNFFPKNKVLFYDEGKTYFNLYKGNKYLNMNDIEYDGDIYLDCPNILELLHNLCGKDEKGVEFVLDTLAMIIQKPYIKTKQLIIFYGEEASGKGTFHELVLNPIFEGYITKILGKKIKSEFNGFMSQNLVLVLEELKADKEEEDTLKELVTEDEILINPKNMPQRKEKNFETIFGFSNEQNPISVGNRRGVYFRSRTLGGNLKNAPEYRKRFEEKIPQELDKFVLNLKNREFDMVQVMKGYETDAKLQVKEQNMSVVERFFQEICDFEDLEKYIRYQVEAGYIDSKIYDYISNIIQRDGMTFVNANLFLDLYNAYLRRSNFRLTILNKMSQFWQLCQIDRDNKDHWRRINTDKKKETFINLGVVNEEIKRRFDSNE